MWLVASEYIAAGQEVRIDYEDGSEAANIVQNTPSKSGLDVWRRLVVGALLTHRSAPPIRPKQTEVQVTRQVGHSRCFRLCHASRSILCTQPASSASWSCSAPQPKNLSTRSSPQLWACRMYRWTPGVVKSSRWGRDSRQR